MTRVVLTGAAGFIGSHVAGLLVAQGCDVVGVDAFTANYSAAAKRRNVAALRETPRFTLIEDDLLLLDLTALLAEADAVVHLAAEPGVSTSWGPEFATYLERNVLATQRVLEAAATAGVPRVVYASSSSVYAPTAGHMHESARLGPVSPYGVSKLAGESLVGAYAHERGLATVALRFFSVYGPRQRPDMAAHRFIEALLDGREAKVYGSPSQMRDFTYVGDVAGAVCAAITAPLRPGTILNISHGTPVGVPTLLGMIEDEVGSALRIDHRPHREGDTGKTHGDSTAAARLLGWRATTGLEVGLAAQVAWHRAVRGISQSSTKTPTELAWSA